MIKLALEHDIHLFCLPPHTTHKLQPLDVGVFGPLQRKWQAHCDEVLTNTGQEPRREDIVKVYMAARNEAINPQLVRTAWRHCGMAPLNQSIFSKDDFAPSATSSTTLQIPASFPRPPRDFCNNVESTSRNGAGRNEDGSNDDVDNNDDHDDHDDDGYGTDDELVDQDPMTRVRLPATIVLRSGCVTDYLESLGADARNLDDPLYANLLSASNPSSMPNPSIANGALPSSFSTNASPANNPHIHKLPADDLPVPANRKRITSRPSTSRHSSTSFYSAEPSIFRPYLHHCYTLRPHRRQ